jgi:hypothetical protein
MNSNLIPLDKLKNIVKVKGLNKYIKDIGYSKVKDKKYFVITIDDKKVNFSYDKMEDYLIHHNDERRKRFRARFRSLYEKFKDDYNKPIFWSWNLCW